MNVLDSVASELDFNNENASICDSSENDEVIDLNNVVNLRDLKKSETVMEN